MNKAFRVLALAALLVTPALADMQSDAQKGIAAQYAAKDAAAEHRDLAGIEAIDVPNTAYVLKDGSVQNPAERHTQLQQVLQHCTAVQDHTTIEGIKLVGGSATVKVSEHIVMNLVAPDGRKGVMTWDQGREDIWMQQGGAWKRQTATLHTENTSIK